ncbi:MAG TPA: tetratricopeptide repeat protein [Gemmataceae bacterium]|nr:tetratricopeptide repeat protein [Gemmataceae bacterium]
MGSPFVTVGLILILGILITGGWLVFGRGPRRRRRYQRALRLLESHSWPEALEELGRIQSLGLLSQAWQARVRRVEGECHRLAGENALREKRFQEGLESLLKSARLLDKDERECRTRVIEEALAEIRRLFSLESSSLTPSKNSRKTPEASNAPKDGSISELIQWVHQLQSPCPEASFWQGLCHAREGGIDSALTSLEESRSLNGQQIFDPSFYLGVLLFREGRIPEALRHLADANRMAPECPLVPWQLGMAMVAEGGKDSLAIRPLQKSLGANGLSAWIKSPRNLWKEALPDRENSYVRRLAEDFSYICPVLGGEVSTMLRQGQAALAQAQYRLGNYSEAAELYEAVLRESPPTLPLIRGLGLSLARLERYDEAFKHLRAAYDLESRDSKGPSALTAGYLALCGAKGRPSQIEDKPKNVFWGIRTLASYQLHGDPEWAQVCNAVFAEARSLNLSIPIADQKRLCDVLASVEATDPLAAAAYYQFSDASPESLRAEHAWLYCRALERHGLENANDLEIFRRAFVDESTIRDFFEKRGWNLEEVEYLFARRCAAATSSDGLAVLSDSLRLRLEAFLLARSERLEQSGQSAEALAAVETLLRLMPQSASAHDRLARLHFQAGNLETAANILAAWHSCDSKSFLPLIRKAVIEQKLGRPDDCLQSIDRALQLTSGSLRGSIAILGGRLALMSGKLPAALELLEACLCEDSGEPTALWCLAAVRSLLGDREALAAQASIMNRAEVTDPRFHYLASVSHLAAGQYQGVIECAQRAATTFPWEEASAQGEECVYLQALAHLAQKDIPSAVILLQRVAESSWQPPSADHARAQLAKIRFSRDSFEDAIQSWKEIQETRRKDWHLDKVLEETLFLAGVQALKTNRLEPAVGFLREAARTNQADVKYHRLEKYALVQAGRNLLMKSDYESAASFFEKAVMKDWSDPAVAVDLARAYKHQGLTAKARRILQNVARTDSGIAFQAGLLSLEEKRLSQAEEDFARAWAEKPNCFEAGYNLLMTRFSLGEVETARILLPQVIELAPEQSQRDFLTLVDRVIRNCSSEHLENGKAPTLADVSPEEEQQVLEFLHNLGNPGIAAQALSALAKQQPDNAALFRAYLEAILVQAKQLLDRGDWNQATRILTPLVEAMESTPRPTGAALLNLLGCCACLTQDFEAGIHAFASALQTANRDARLSQNLALAYEMHGRHSEAEPHWNWFLEMLDGRLPSPPESPGYKNRLAFECLHRLGVRSSERGKWTSALAFLQRAHQVQPEDADTLERLFHVFNQLKKPEDARRALRRLRQLRPQDPQMEFFELELIEIDNLDNCNRVLAGLEALHGKYPDDARVAERQAQLLGAITTYLKRLTRQIVEQSARAASRVRRLPTYQEAWPEMKHYLRDLRSRLNRTRKTALRSLPLATSESHRRDLQHIIQQTSQEIDQCQTLV